MTLVLTNMCIWPKHVLTNVFTNICSMHWKIFAHQDVHGKDAFSNSLHTWAVMVWAIQYLNLSQVRGLKTLTGKGIGTGDRNQTQINFVSPSALSIFPVHPARCEGTIGNMKTHFRVSWIEFTLQDMNSHFQFSICIFGKRTLQDTSIFWLSPVAKHWSVVDIGRPTDDHLFQLNQKHQDFKSQGQIMNQVRLSDSDAVLLLSWSTGRKLQERVFWMHWRQTRQLYKWQHKR